MGQHNKLYKSAIWQALRGAHLQVHPLCVFCLQSGRHTPGYAVDHIAPHRGDMRLFADPANLQTLCKPHHNRTKQIQETRGYAPGADNGGYPLDTTHPWYRRGISR